MDGSHVRTLVHIGAPGAGNIDIDAVVSRASSHQSCPAAPATDLRAIDRLDHHGNETYVKQTGGLEDRLPATILMLLPGSGVFANALTAK